jgi:hypothetical protein
MNDLLIHISFIFLLLAYFYRLWFINRKEGKEKQFSRNYQLIYYTYSEDDTDELRKLKRKINILTTLNYLFITVLAFMIIRQKFLG